MKVWTPVAGVNDTVGLVSFVNGEADVDPDKHAAELRYFRSAGYTIEESTVDGETTEESSEDETVVTDVDGDGVPEELPKKSASTEVWRAFAVEHGMTEDNANQYSRDELVARYYKEDGQ